METISYKFTHNGRTYHNTVYVNEVTAEEIELVAKNMVQTFERVAE